MIEKKERKKESRSTSISQSINQCEAGVKLHFYLFGPWPAISEDSQKDTAWTHTQITTKEDVWHEAHVLHWSFDRH